MHGFDFQQARQSEFASAVFLQVSFDEVGQTIEHAVDLFFAQAAVGGQGVEDCGFGELLFDRAFVLSCLLGFFACHTWFSLLFEC